VSSGARVFANTTGKGCIKAVKEFRGFRVDTWQKCELRLNEETVGYPGGWMK